MKKLISALAASVLAFSASAMPVSAAEKLTFTDDSDTHISDEYIVGDVNNDGEINISDMVVLSSYLRGKKSERNDVVRSDLNYDDSVDVFDLIELRKLLIAPETAKKGTKAIDILASAKQSAEKSIIARSTDDVAAYLSAIGTDEAEIQKYLDIYNDSFFKDNCVILAAIKQKYGNGIHYTIGIGSRFDNRMITLANELSGGDKKDDIFGFITAMTYEEHPMLYPEKNNILLFQYTVPAQAVHSPDTAAGCIDLSGLLTSDYSAYKYSSPDEKRSIYITQEAYLLMSEVNVYYVNDDGTYSFAAYLTTDDGCNPFDGDGRWEKDEDGNDVFTNGESYKMTWSDSEVVIEYWFEQNKWETATIAFDRSLINTP